VAGGVVVGGYFANDSALGFLRLICLCLTLRVLGVSVCGCSVSDLIQYFFCDISSEVIGIEWSCVCGFVSAVISITSAFFSRFLPAIPAKSEARLELIPWVTSWLTCRRAEGCAQL